jgi:hypothetical protein
MVSMLPSSSILIVAQPAQSACSLEMKYGITPPVPG